MKISLSQHFTYPKLLRFVLPSIVMMIFTSIYSVVDGLFVSNFVGKTPFAAINLVMPLLIILGALGFMIGTGGTAYVAKTMGEGKKELANRYFSMLVYATLIGGVVLALLGQLFARPVSVFLGASGEMLEYCVQYCRVILCALPFFMLQNVFQSFFVAAEKPKLGLAVTLLAGMANIVLDALFVAAFRWGLLGAAIATSISQLLGGLLPILYFGFSKDSPLRLCKTKFYGRVFLGACANGSSELMSNISASVVTILYNFQLMRFAGEDGVSAYGVVMYVSFIFAAIFIGYAVGSSPIVSYHYGAQNTQELKNMFRKSTVLLSVTGILMTALALALSVPLSSLFVGYDQGLYQITLRGFLIFSLSFLPCGLNIFGSSFFTALNNGVISAILSFMRTFLFQTVCILLLPVFWELDGVWIASVAAELLALIVTLILLITNRKRYHYL